MREYISCSRKLPLLAAFFMVLCWSLMRAAVADEAVPVPWNGMDIGLVQPAGSAKTDSGTFILSGSGKLAGSSDAFHFVYQSVSGDCTLSARVNTPDDLADAGLMIRDALATTSNFVAVVSSPGSGAASIFRTLFVPATATVNAGGGAPLWVKLIKRGASVESYMAADNGDMPGVWKQIGNAQPTATGMIYVGLCLTSHASGTGGTAVFDHVSLSTGAQPLLDNGVYTIVPSSAPSMVLAANGTAVNLAPPVSSSNQKWRLVNKGGSFYSIHPASDPSLALTVPGAKSDYGIKVTVAADQGQESQVWSIVANSNGTYSLLPHFNSNIGLDDFGGIGTPDAVIDIWGYVSSDPHLQWTLNPAQ